MPKGMGQKTVKSVMDKFESGKLHSGSKSGPTVRNPKQAIAIGINEGYPGGYGKPGSPPPPVKHHGKGY